MTQDTIAQPNDCATRHTVYVYDRGAATRLFQVDPIVSVDWERVKDDTSMSNVRIKASQCSVDMSVVEPGRHELVVFRGDKRVWEGPLTYMTYYADTLELQARDVTHYVYRTVMRKAYNNAYPNITTCIQRSVNILKGELPRKEALDPPINVLPYVTPVFSDDDSRTSRKTIAMEKTAFDDIDDMARNSGMDYTTVGRRIVLFDTDTALGRTPPLTEADVTGDVKVTVYGMEVATFAVVTGADGAYGTAVGKNGDPDPYYGNWEILDDAYDEAEGTDVPTQAELNSQASRNVTNRIPTPVELRIPDGSTLAHTSPLYDPDLLVPGVQVPVRAQLGGRMFSQIQKLYRVKWIEDADGERCELTLTPSPNSAIPDSGGD